MCVPPFGGGLMNTTEVGYFVGFDIEQKSAWRSMTSEGSSREYTSVLRPPRDDAADHECAIAHWPDGYVHEMPYVSVRELTNMEADPKMQRCRKYMRRLASNSGIPGRLIGAATASDSGTIWAGTCAGGKRVSVVIRVDRALANGSRARLVALFIAGAQKAQLSLVTFADQEEKVRAVMIDLGKAVVDGLPLEHVKEKRDELVKLMGLVNQRTAEPKKKKEAGKKSRPQRRGHLRVFRNICCLSTGLFSSYSPYFESDS